MRASETWSFLIAFGQITVPLSSVYLVKHCDSMKTSVGIALYTELCHKNERIGNLLNWKKTSDNYITF